MLKYKVIPYLGLIGVNQTVINDHGTIFKTDLSL